jgi:L-ascorbate metabolism protein UlaG (beta-lactamase superfamily)
MSIMKGLALPLVSLGLLAATAEAPKGAELSYFGRSSVKIKTAEGLVIYIDPYAPGDYSEAADLILVTHGHSDHNRIGLVAKKTGTVIAAPAGAVSAKGAKVLDEGSTFTVGSVSVRALPASNKNHARGESLGYLVSFNGIVLYHSGDTSYLPEMASWGSYGITYALMPCDGYYNMGPEETAKCAAAMKAKAIIPIHSSKDGLYDERNAKAVKGDKVIVLAPGDKTRLLP